MKSRSECKALGPVLCSCGAPAETGVLSRVPHPDANVRLEAMREALRRRTSGRIHVNWRLFLALRDRCEWVVVGPRLSGRCRSCFNEWFGVRPRHLPSEAERLYGSWEEVDEYDRHNRVIGRRSEYIVDAR